jgi:hypothetical protein
LQSLQILYTFVLRAEIATIFGPNVVAISARKYKSIQNLRTLQGCIFHILQHFATTLCNFTHFSMFFLAVVIYLHLLAYIHVVLKFVYNGNCLLNVKPFVLKHVHVKFSEIDPCKLSNVLCGKNAVCNKTGPGQHECVCHQGYRGDGVVCTGNKLF